MSNTHDDQGSDEQAQFDALTHQWEQPDPHASSWDEFRAAAREFCTRLWNDARDRSSPQWPPTWLRISALVAALLVAVFVVVPVITWLLSLAAAATGAAAGAGFSWLAAWELTDQVTQPVRDYLDTAAPALGLEPVLLWWIWVGLAVGLGVLSMFGSFGARVGWVLLGAATAAIAYSQAPAGGAALAAAIVVAWWAVLSIVALGRVYPPQPHLSSTGRKTRGGAGATMYSIATGEPFHRMRPRTPSDEACDLMDALADTVDIDHSDSGGDAYAHARELAEQIRRVRVQVQSLQEYPVVPARYEFTTSRWRTALHECVRVRQDPHAEAAAESVPPALLSAYAHARARELKRDRIRHARSGTSAPYWLDLDAQLGQTVAWLWQQDQHQAIRLLVDIFSSIRIVTWDGMQLKLPVSHFVDALAYALPEDFADCVALTTKAARALSTANS